MSTQTTGHRHCHRQSGPTNEEPDARYDRRSPTSLSFASINVRTSSRRTGLTHLHEVAWRAIEFDFCDRRITGDRLTR